MKRIETQFHDVYLFEPQVFEDSRGFFMESYNARRWKEFGIAADFIQDNHAYSKQAGVIRGLHYQLPPKAQTKLIRVTRGAIYDVIVDIRKSSPTFGQWFGAVLSEENKRQLLVPRGFAHGYCTLVDHTEVQYKVDEYYAPEHERGIQWDDPELKIDWPVSNPILSEKDRAFPPMNQAPLFD